MAPEEIVRRASGDDPEGLVDLAVETDRSDDDLLRPWSEMKRASPLPLSEHQYDAFLRGEDVPNEEGARVPVAEAPRLATRLLAYAALVLLSAAGLAAIWVAFLVFSRHSGTVPDFAGIWMSILGAAALAIASLVTQVKVLRELQRGRDRRPHDRTPNRRHQPT